MTSRYKSIILNIIFVSSLFLFGSTVGLANTPRGDIGWNLEVSTKYIWRGIEYGSGVTFFPKITYQRGGFSAQLLGAYASNASHREINLGIDYTLKGFAFGLNNSYFPTSSGNTDQYFEWLPAKTKHYIETYATYKPLKFPIWILVSTYIYGADKLPSGQQAYSSYVELGYRHSFSEKNSLSLGAGSNINRAFYTDYCNELSVVNIFLTYESYLLIENLSLPISVSYILNPYKEKAFMTFSLTL